MELKYIDVIIVDTENLCVLNTRKMSKNIKKKEYKNGKL